MIKGRIAIPDKDLKTWRSHGRKRKPAIAVPTRTERSGWQNLPARQTSFDCDTVVFDEMVESADERT